ncbi:MAG: translation initiation factor IF-2 [Candidatus Aenigmarchaeota archaeon]|nr:translation initiation factor IF-2 [Candidatus Aenigmarchaeota archaeon]NIP40698.1 translation initiation factor IF-2 [Candidatus Aenigmarchaeota archaeon]NIQ18504.1 translation initiation factor IF-2 [Candidatus Aenigmarchaeota archaeon]NIS73403.1 translation initiation factor IF-2 [Candidatus Aenigmarchaeota archaeon]
MPIRQPIISVLGHVDSGKTTLLDKIRGSAVAPGEAGGITQHIGASEIPIKNIMGICGDLVKKMGIDVKIPGLLFIDTPGHEAFTTLRKRGGSISDLAILIIDINEGFQPQTEESLIFLKEFKTPFVVAATKIDRILGWRSEDVCFLPNFKEQEERVQNEVEEKIYRIVGQLGEKGFKSERYDRVGDFAKEICIVPVSGVTGEGIPDLLVVLTGLAQRYLEERLEVTSGMGKGTILEVREFKGLGTTIDVILYDGVVNRGDTLVVGGKEIFTTKVKALLKPEPLKEMRVEKMFRPVGHVSAATGVKISAPNLENVIAGSPVRFLKSERDLGKAKEDIEREIEEVEIETENEGLILKADTLGSLEGLIKALRDLKIPIRKAKVGNVLKSDVMESSGMENPVIFAFHVEILPDASESAKKQGVRIFKSSVIYKLIEDYQEWGEEEKRRKEKELLESVTHPGRVKILPGYVFRQSKPAIFGVEVLGGMIKPGYKLRKREKTVGEVKELQMEGENVDKAKAGDKVALSMEGVTIGRQVSEGDTLETVMKEKDFEVLNKFKSKLPGDERKLLEEFGGK